MVSKRIVLITEYLNPPFDEGIKKTAYILFNILNENFETYTFSKEVFEHPNLNKLVANKLFYNSNLKKKIKQIDPKAIIYFPFQSGTLASYLRQWVLQKTFKKKRVIFFTLQPKPLSWWKRAIVKLIKPQVGVTTSLEVKVFWEKIRVNSKLVPLYTNLENFNPSVDRDRKIMLRLKYRLPQDSIIITHIGHLNYERNLESLIPLNKDQYQVVIVSSSSTPVDAIGPDSLEQKLIDNGIIILHGYIKDIQEIYQLSDLYIFPIIEKCGSISMPLSILEARACGIPVITTNFGSVKYFLEDDEGSIFYSIPEGFTQTLKEIPIIGIKKSTKVKKLNTIFTDTIKEVIENDFVN